jgi:hypothetical protein
MFLGSPKVQGGPKPMSGTFGGFNDINRTSQLYRDIGLQYKLNGTGRDTYIWSNNGGFSLQHYEPNGYDKPGTMLPKINRRASPEKRPYIHSKAP